MFETIPCEDSCKERIFPVADEEILFIRPFSRLAQITGLLRSQQSYRPLMLRILEVAMQTGAETRKKQFSGLKCILILEDDPANRWLLHYLIQRETPYEVLLAANGEEALRLVQRIAPNLILLDYALPGLNGLQVYAQLTAQPGWENVPAILVTAWSDHTEVRASHLRCIAKPYDPYALLEVLHHQLDDEKKF